MKIIEQPKLDPNAPNFLDFLKTNMSFDVKVQRLFELGPNACYMHALWISGGVALAFAWRPNYLFIIGESQPYKELAQKFERQYPHIEVTLEIV